MDVDVNVVVEDAKGGGIIFVDPHSVDPYMLERWYSNLQPHTPHTTFLRLSKECAQAIMKGCEERRGKGICTPAQKELLKDMVANMQAHMKEPCFVKLAARSCKDSILRSSNFKNVLAKELEELEALDDDPKELEELEALDDDPKHIANSMLCSYVRAQAFAMKRSTPEEALNDFLESRRIYEDLTLACLEPQFNMSVVFRKWDPNLVPEKEIRCFVVDRTVTAMTQYYSSVFVPALASSKETLCRKILHYLNATVIPLLPELSSFTIDVGVPQDEEASPLTIVEINPPAPRSGTSLFNWNHGTSSSSCSDNDILLGKANFEFRVLTAPLPLETLMTERKATFEHLAKLGYDIPTVTQKVKDDKCVLQ